MSTDKRPIDLVATESEAGTSPESPSPAVTENVLGTTIPVSSPVLALDQSIRSGRRRKKQKVIDIPPVPTKPGQCHFFVKGKGRYCKLRAKLAHKYCGEHSMLEGTNGVDPTKTPSSPTAKDSANDPSVRKRVPCPLDSSHTVWEDDLDSHTARCNARPKISAAYVQDINLSLPEPAEPILAQDMLSKLTPEELLALVAKIEALCDKYLPPIRTMILDHPALNERKKTIKNIKHAHQQASLLGHMERLGLLSDPRACFIEFGAGRGELSRYLKEALHDRGLGNFVLVDRMAVRNKFDSYIAGIDQVPHKSYVARRWMDIKDLKLEALHETERREGSIVPEEEKYGTTATEGSKTAAAAANSNRRTPLSTKTRRPVVALSKHLCGGATDITLKCLVDYKDAFPLSEQAEAVRGVLIALCCHQCCRHYMYPNQAFLKECGITEREFALISRMSSWGVSSNKTKTLGTNGEADGEAKKEAAPRTPKDGEGDEDDEEEDEHGLVDTGAKDLASNISVLTYQKRVELGLRCKRLLDVGRVQYLEQHGFDAEVVYYTDPDTSLENLALMAVPKPSN
ncbi:tRNA:m(4)X modification enzyme TRM13 [Actinomortierella ambigua]|nr:tRNA:m(4)X modification enzyme TRM13 [Actinomortierella ambigua]